MSNMKKWLLCLCSVLMIGCSDQTAQTEITPSPASETVETLQDYTELKEENAFEIIDSSKVDTMLDHGTGVLYFSFPECPWCQRYITYLNTVAEETGVTVKYYNIRNDKGTEWYQEVAEKIHDKNPDISRYNNDGDYVIYMPLTLFLKDGEIIGYDDTSCDLDSDEIAVDDYWTQQRQDLLHEKLTAYFTTTKENIDKGNKEGCAVKVEEDGCN